MKHACIRAALALSLISALAAPGAAQDGVSVGRQFQFTRLVSADEVERQAGLQYAQLMQQARQQNALAAAGDPHLRRLRAIAARITPFAAKWNARAKDWRWEINLIRIQQVNAFCMPGGKIGFFSGIIDSLRLTDDEIAIVLGHEIAHALREHVREQMGKRAATNLGANLFSQLLGLNNAGNLALGLGANLLSLKFSRDDESEADLVGLELTARAGYDPSAGVTLWRKMQQASGGTSVAWLSTHPPSGARISEIERHLPAVMPLYRRARSR